MSSTEIQNAGWLARAWGEIRSRRLLPTFLVYCGGAFGLMQAIDIVFNRYHVGQFWFDVAAIFLLCGVPGSLLIAWFHGQPGAQAIQRKEVALQALLFVLAAFLSFRAWVSNGEREPETAGATSIVVLPFRNLSDSRSDDYLGEGVTDGVIARLSRVSGLRVSSRVTSMRYRDSRRAPRQIGGELGVENVLEGSVRQDGHRVHVTARLVRVRTGEETWAGTYDRDPRDLLDLQGELAEEVAIRLRTRVTGEERHRIQAHPTGNVEAYQALLRGRYFVDRAGPEDRKKAVLHFQEALERDPLMAEAYAGLALAYVNGGLFFDSANSTMPKARAYAEKALALDPDLASPQWVLGVVAFMYEWDFEKARKYLVKDNVVRPEALLGFGCLGHLLQSLGRAKDSEASLKHALDEDPVSVALTAELGCNSYYGRRFEESIARFREALRLDPNNFVARYGLGRSFAQVKDFGQAVAELERIDGPDGPTPPIVLGELGYVHALAGHREQAREMLRRLQGIPRDVYVDPYFVAEVHLGLGARDEAFAWLDRAYDDRSTMLVSIPSDPRWDPLRKDARFRRLLHRMGL